MRTSAAGISRDRPKVRDRAGRPIAPLDGRHDAHRDPRRRAHHRHPGGHRDPVHRPARGRPRDRDESARLADAIALLQEQAQLEGRDYGILLETARYEFQRFDAFEQRWATVEGDPVLRARELPPGLAFELTLEGRAILLRREPVPEARLPQLVAWGSGEVTPYRLAIVRQGGGRVTLVGAADGSIEIERGDERG
jgi:general secretion pathway protein H